MLAPQPPQRVSPFTFPEEFVLPERPEHASRVVQDSYRQTQFLLGPDLRLFAEGANLQLRLVRAASASRFRTHRLAALLGLWSRVYLNLADSLLLVTRGSYASVPPLVRSAAECIAAQEALRAGDMDIYLEWLAAALGIDEAHKAVDFELGRYFAGEVLASDPELRAVYRPVSDLGRPNFGATLLLVGSESNRTRVMLAFADRAFHLGWAQITLGWLLTLNSAQLGVLLHAESIFPADEEARLAVHRWRKEVESLLQAPDRCRIRESEEDGRRYLVENFRRTSGAAQRRILL